MEHKLRIKRFQENLNKLNQPDILLLGVGYEDDGSESIIASSSIDDPRMMLSGLAQLCADDDGFYTLFKSAVEIAESHFQEDHFDD